MQCITYSTKYFPRDDFFATFTPQTNRTERLDITETNHSGPRHVSLIAKITVKLTNQFTRTGLTTTIHWTLMMASAQVVKTLVTTTDNSSPRDYTHPDEQTTRSRVICPFYTGLIRSLCTLQYLVCWFTFYILPFQNISASKRSRCS